MKPSPYEQLSGDKGSALLAGLTLYKEERVTDAVAYARSRAEPDVAAAALATAFARRRASAAGKFSRAGDMLFTRAGYEQASSEAVARHRATRFANFQNVADLCCGIGSDTIALANAAESVMSVDLDADALACTHANADALGVGARVTTTQADVLEIDVSRYDAVFADPSRRPGGVRVRRADRYAPPIESLLSRAAEIRGRRLAVKTAPGLNFDDQSWSARLHSAPLEIEVVSERGTCKEAVLWCGELARCDGARRATVIDETGAHILDGDPAAQVEQRPLGNHIGEPDPAVIRAGLIAAACAGTDAGPVDARVGYVTADTPPPSPFVRWYPLIDAMPFNVKRVRAVLRSRGIGGLTVKTRAFPLKPEEIISLLKPAGDGRATLICVTFGEKKWALLCGTVGA
ncbi:MAG TPA: class I SAM-dependent methyltransferase [Candidatus Eremiobacteraceae bacterium]|nr:class I SAM-dependent methyltransferase [Candidatus Eremiobacteraceae bacterium]